MHAHMHSRMHACKLLDICQSHCFFFRSFLATCVLLLCCLVDCEAAAPGDVVCVQETMLLVGAGTERLLLAAEMQEMKKPHTDGFHREVTVQDIESFIGSGE